MFEKTRSVREVIFSVLNLYYDRKINQSIPQHLDFSHRDLPIRSEHVHVLFKPLMLKSNYDNAAGIFLLVVRKLSSKSENNYEVIKRFKNQIFPPNEILDTENAVLTTLLEIFWSVFTILPFFIQKKSRNVSL